MIFVVSQIVFLVCTAVSIFLGLMQNGNGDPQLITGWISKLIVGSIIYCCITLILLGFIILLWKFFARKKSL